MLTFQWLKEVIGTEFTLEGADMSGELLGRRLVGANFQNVFLGVAGSGDAEGLT